MNLKGDFMTKKMLLILMFISCASLSRAGGVDGGGGGAFVCRDSKGNLLNSELLDLWEAGKINQLEIERSQDEIDIQIENAILKLDPLLTEFLNPIRLEVKTIMANARALSADVGLPVPKDANPKYQKKNCSLEGMMYFDGDLNKVFYNMETYEKLLSNTDKAAAWAHEAIYKYMREHYGETNSFNSRKLVGCLFAKDCDLKSSLMTIEERLKIESTSNDESGVLFKCADEKSEFYISGNSTQEIVNGLERQVFHQKKVYYTKVNNWTFRFPQVDNFYTVKPDQSDRGILEIHKLPTLQLEKFGFYWGTGLVYFSKNLDLNDASSWKKVNALLAMGNDNHLESRKVDCTRLK